MNLAGYASLMEEPGGAARDGCPHVYSVYGITLHSEIPLSLPQDSHGSLAHLELRTGTASFFRDAIQGLSLDQATGSWYRFGRLADGSSYASWQGVGEYLVSSDGRRIVCRQFDAATSESFQVYLLGQALSFALVLSGFEPLHATVVVVDGQAVGFLGESGFGKSTLAACFVSGGYPVLTDDLLLLQAKGGCVLAYPGPPRIKLFPKTARKFFGGAANGVRMNPDTEKLILPLDRKHSSSVPVPLKGFYSLAAPREVFRKQPIRFEPLSPRQAFFELVRNTFNYRIVDADRMQRQLAAATRLVNLVPVKKLSLPRNLGRLASFRAEILLDLAAEPVETPVCVD